MSIIIIIIIVIIIIIIIIIIYRFPTFDTKKENICVLDRGLKFNYVPSNPALLSSWFSCPVASKISFRVKIY